MYIYDIMLNSSYNEMFQTRFVEKTFYVQHPFSENRAICEITIYGTYALNAECLQTHTQNMYFLLLFHDDNGFAYSRQHYVTRTVPVLLSFELLRQQCTKVIHNRYPSHGTKPSQKWTKQNVVKLTLLTAPELQDSCH
jgi:hypothetical protein